MSWATFDDECQGCRPAILDLKTRKAMPESSPEMQAVMGIWAHTFKQEREAFHRVSCHNSRSAPDMRLYAGLMQKIKDALEALPKTD